MQWQGCNRILKYLKEISNYGLFYTPGREMKIEAFTDADWSADKDDTESTGGYCIYLARNHVSWSAKKQRIISKSSIEVEYRAL